MSVPPVFCVADLQPELIEDLRDASRVYVGYDYTSAFDEIILMPERQAVLQAFLTGDAPANEVTDALRDWLLRKWSSTRSLGGGRMDAVAEAMTTIRASVAAMPANLLLEHADAKMLAEMVKVFHVLDACAGVGATIASKLLAPLRCPQSLWSWFSATPLPPCVAV